MFFGQALLVLHLFLNVNNCCYSIGAGFVNSLYNFPLCQQKYVFFKQLCIAKQVRSLPNALCSSCSCFNI